MRSKILSVLAATAMMVTPALAGDGMIHQMSSSSVEDTVDSFVKVLESKGATVFARVDHAAGAKKVDMEMSPATLVIFGNPKIGTPLMQAAPTMGVDLPLRVLFYADEDGKTHIAYHDLDKVAEQHGVPADHPALAKAKGAMAKLTGAVAK